MVEVVCFMFLGRKVYFFRRCFAWNIKGRLSQPGHLVAPRPQPRPRRHQIWFAAGGVSPQALKAEETVAFLGEKWINISEDFSWNWMEIVMDDCESSVDDCRMDP